MEAKAMENNQAVRVPVERKKAYVQEFLQEYERKGGVSSTFARDHGLNESTFIGWIRKYDTGHVYPDRGRYQAAGSGDGHPFVRIGGDGAERLPGVRIEYGGCVIRFDGACTAEDLRKVLSAIRGVAS
jgi:hypothetical protein